MKKRILLIVIASFMFMGVVSAASLWGNYKGNQIIRLTVNDDPVKVSDVPAISYNGRTMIPIYLLKDAGINYSWDQKNQTVDIKKDKQQVGIDSDSLKAIVTAADFYNTLENLGDLIYGLDRDLSLVFDGIRFNDGDKPNYERLNKVIDSYNFYQNLINSKRDFLKIYGINIDKAYGILDDYRDSLEAYKKAFSGMDIYLISQTDSNFNEYLDNARIGSSKVHNGMKVSFEQYRNFISIALNY